MTDGIKTIMFPVKDLSRAKSVFQALLGVEPSMDEAYYAGFSVGDQDVGLDPMATKRG
jgi:hypothetical protein